MTLYGRMPDIPAVRVGTRLELGADEWKLGRPQEPGEPFTLIVTRVRTELAHHYGNE